MVEVNIIELFRVTPLCNNLFSEEVGGGALRRAGWFVLNVSTSVSSPGDG